MQNIIKEAKKLALSKKSPPEVLFIISEKKALEICDKFDNINKTVVHVGVCLMDVMLGEALSQNKISEHVKMSVEATKKFLENYDLSQENKNKIINCVEAHHKDVPFNCKEAEICANADCYRFLSPKGIFAYFQILGERSNKFDKILEQVENKMEEKWKILSLDICKKELTPYYKNFKTLLKEAKK